MTGLGYSIWLQFKLDVRNKNVLSAYYVLPIAFYLVIGAIIKEIDPTANTTLVQSMSVLAVSLAAFLGTPAPIVDFFTSDTKKTYIVGNIKLSVVLLTTFLSGLVHMLIVSLLIYFTAPFVFGVTRPTEVFMYFGWLLITITISTVIGMIIGLISKSNSSMTMTSQRVFLPTMLLCGIMLPTDILPTVLQKIGEVLPGTYFIQILTSLNQVTFEMIMPLILVGFIGMVALTVLYKRALVK